MNEFPLQWWYPVAAWGVVVATGVQGILALFDRGRTDGGTPWVVRWRWLPVAAAFTMAVPIDGLPVGRWLHGFSSAFSIPFVLLLAERVARPLFGRPLLDARGQRSAVLFAIVAGALLYPAALGIGTFDPYALGWRSPGVAVAAAVIGAVLLARNDRFGVLLLAAGVAWRAGVLESSNAWDALVDPVYFLCAAGNAIAGAVGRRRVAAVIVLVIAAATGHGASAGGLAESIRDWEIPEETGRFVVVRIEPSLERPAALADDEGPAWDAFVAERKIRAESIFRGALAIAENAARLPSVGLGCEAMRLMHRAVREDPDHAGARAACGWVRRDNAWVSPATAARIDRGRPVAEAGRPQARAVDHGWKITGDHWEIVSSADRAAALALAADLDHARMAWRQAFGGFEVPAGEIVRRARGGAEAAAVEPFFARLAKDRAEYVAAIAAREPAIHRTLGAYWAPSRTAWFVDPADASTVLHEAAHQMFMERPASDARAGERCNFWAIEAAACFMESLAPSAHGWTLGGQGAGRGPAARRRLVDEGFFVPLDELCRMGRREFQSDQRLPMLYGQLGGLADFFICGDGGRRRRAFLDCLARVYDDTAEAGTLAELCGERFEDLDEAYRRHVAR